MKHKVLYEFSKICFKLVMEHNKNDYQEEKKNLLNLRLGFHLNQASF